MTIGPNIEDGFFYDFARNEPFTPDDLPKIEAKMREIVASDLPTTRTVWKRDEAVEAFRGHRRDIQGRDHPRPAGGRGSARLLSRRLARSLPRPAFAVDRQDRPGFKLTKIAGAYWRGDAKNAQLQRIYGTAWRDEKELAAYLQRLEEAEKRDHRKIGKEMDLFHIQEEAVGQVFWHPEGLDALSHASKTTSAARSSAATIAK